MQQRQIVSVTLHLQIQPQRFRQAKLLLERLGQPIGQRRTAAQNTDNGDPFTAHQQRRRLPRHPINHSLHLCRRVGQKTRAEGMIVGMGGIVGIDSIHAPNLG